ncbi:MAG TPA: DUF433 domain-containing protein [Burkholderiaceae bacterium]
MELIGIGLYPLAQAARLAGAEPRAVRRWLRGYNRRHRGQSVRSEPLWETQLRDDALMEDVIGFRDLLELRMVATFVRHGVDLRVIRATLETARRDFGESHPLTNRRFLSDGRRIFLEAIEQATGEARMIDVLRRQHVFSDIIRPSLYAGIEYADGGARRWFPEGRRKVVVLDPALQFGTPVLTDAGIPTDTVHAAFLAEGRDRNSVARIFSITPAMVSAAVEFEQRLAA